MIRTTLSIALVAVLASSSYGAPPRREAKPTEERREEQRRSEGKGATPEELKSRSNRENSPEARNSEAAARAKGGGAAEARPMTPEAKGAVLGKVGAHGGAEGPRGGGRPEGKVSLAQLIDGTGLEPEMKKEIKAANEAQEKELSANAESKESVEGLAIREAAFAAGVGKEKELTEKGKKTFLGDLWGRLIGKEKGTEKDAEALKDLVCPGRCGHKGMEKACRVVVNLIKVAGVTGAAAAITAYLNSEPKACSASECVLAMADGSTKKFSGLDRPVTEEKLAQPPKETP